MKTNWLKTLLKILGSALIIWLLVSRISWDTEEFTRVFSALNLWWLSLSLSGVLLVLGFKSLRWNHLLVQEDCKYPKLKSFSVYMASFTLGLITPGRIGEIARLYYIREDTGISFYKSFKTIVSDRIFDFAFLIWFGITGMLYYYKLLGDFNGSIYLLIIGFVLLFAWGVVSYLLKKFVKPDSSISFRFIRETWNGMFRSAMVFPWIMTIIAYFLYYLANQLIFKSIGFDLNIIDVSFVLSLMSLATLIPVSLAGFGTREASLVYLLSFYGVSPETAIVFSLLQFSAFFLWGGLIGLLFWIVKPVKIRLIKDDYQAFVRYFKGEKSS